jgi:site-specific DNA recombinase
LADPDRGWDAIVIGEYERAFYGGRYASMAPLSEHYGIQLWMPEVGGRVDWHAEDHEQTMLALGLSSKREITRTRIGSAPRWPPRPRSRAATWAGGRHTGTGWETRGRTRTRRTRPGNAARTSWNRTR